MIYVIGDSHSSVFCGKDHIQPQWGHSYTKKGGVLIKNKNKFVQDNPNFCSIRSGTQLAYNMLNKTELIDNIISDYDIDKINDYLFFYYGEIDIRAHVGFRSDRQNKKYQEINQDIVNRYIDFLLVYKNLGYKVGVIGPLASTLDHLNYTPRYKNCKVRNEMTNNFNELLKKESNKHNINYKSFFTYMLDENGLTKEEYLMDQLHASQLCMNFIEKEFNDII
jgi:hypothetical protein